MPVLTVTQFNKVINELIEPLEVVVEGEISQWQVWQGKYIYAAIKDDGATAQIFATIYDIKNSSSIKIGMKVKVTGKPSVHVKNGKLSLNAYEISPIGDGAMALAFEELKKRLEKEGLFDTSRKRMIPQFPQNIGFITAKDSQAYNDFTKILNERWQGFTIHFYSAQVQGKDSVNSLIEAIKHFNEKFNDDELDVLVIARGGGSSEDLISFNDEGLVRAVFGSKFPVVSGVGHEGDFTLIDYVADLRASTPSNAAELISPDKKDLMKRLNQFQSILNKDIKNIVDGMEKDLAQLTVDLDTVVSKRLDNLEDKIASYSRLLNSFDYKNTLKRGFAIVRNKESIVKNSKEAKYAVNVNIEFSDGSIDAKVITNVTDENISMF